MFNVNFADDWIRTTVSEAIALPPKPQALTNYLLSYFHNRLSSTKKAQR